MNTIKVKDGNGNDKFIKGFGEGTVANPFAYMMADIDIHLPAGDLPDHRAVNKFGQAVNCDADVNTDIWDGADALLNQPGWKAPEVACVHTLKSDSVQDGPVGTGARTIRVYGLPSWSDTEVWEDVTMNGASPVATFNQYVIIHRMKAIPNAASIIANTGTITATTTGQTTNTITAMIRPYKGQTLMAVYGIPAGEVALMPNYYASCTKGTASLAVGVGLWVNPSPDVNVNVFLEKNAVGLTTEGSNFVNQPYNPYYKISGPAIIKIVARSSANNTIVAAGFNLIRLLS